MPQATKRKPMHWLPRYLLLGAFFIVGLPFYLFGGIEWKEQQVVADPSTTGSPEGKLGTSRLGKQFRRLPGRQTD
ncbi:hypothetical protein MUP07_00805 [Candidatus Bathyarchaeota archaeon]|nr:hypothetical protein [Candidatus Bathyarchaeota archaeon]